MLLNVPDIDDEDEDEDEMVRGCMKKFILIHAKIFPQDAFTAERAD